jgi:sugar phosphate isomerase/epimerase
VASASQQANAMLEGFAVSNIAWPRSEFDRALRLMPELGVSGVEIAPRNVFDSWDVHDDAVRHLRRRIGDAGLVCPSLQGILFGVNEATLFGGADSRHALRAHLEKVARMAGLLGARACVFGAPKQRDVGALSTADAMAIAIEFFRSIAPIFESEGTAIAFEANAAYYGCNFTTTTAQAITFVHAVDRPGVRLQIDTGTILLEEEDPIVLRDAAPLCVHAHVSEPDLRAVGQSESDHRPLAATLKSSGYDGFLSIEMRCTDDWEGDLLHAAAFVRECYQ